MLYGLKPNEYETPYGTVETLYVEAFFYTLEKTIYLPWGCRDESQGVILDDYNLPTPYRNRVLFKAFGRKIKSENICYRQRYWDAEKEG